jgi:putative tricarboxylic transport membrane protein
MERSLRRSLALSGGEWGVLFSSPIAITLWVLAAVSLVAPLALSRVRRHRMLPAVTGEL